jgi:hypothetical protein
MAITPWIWTWLIVATSPMPMNYILTHIKPTRDEPPFVPPTDRPGAVNNSPGSPPSHRAGFLVLSMICMGVLGGLFGRLHFCPTKPCSSDILGNRIRHMDRNSVKALTLTHYLVFIQYFFGTAFVFSAGILVCGECGAAMRVLSSLTQIPAKRAGPSVHENLCGCCLLVPWIILQ